MAPPIHTSDVPAIAANFSKGMMLLGTFANFGLEPPRAPQPSAALFQDYGLMVRSVNYFSDQRFFSGWLMHERFKSIVVEASDGSATPLDFYPSPDVQKAFASYGPRAIQMNAGSARFHFSVACEPTCYIVMTTFKGAVTRIPLIATTVDFKSPSIIYHLDTTTAESPYISGDDRLKTSILFSIARGYQNLVPWCILASLALVAFRLLFRLSRRSERFAEYTVLVVGVGAACSFLILLLGVMSALSYYSFYPEYMSPLYPLTLFACSVAIVFEFQAVYRTVASARFSAGTIDRSSRRITPPARSVD